MTQPATVTNPADRVCGVLALVSALAILGGCAAAGTSEPSALASHGPASPTASTPGVPSTTVAPASEIWSTGRYSVGGDLSYVVDVTADGAAYLTEEPFITSRDAYTISGSTVTFAGESCNGVTGTYRWSRDGTSLHLAPVDDPCTERALLLGMPLDLLREQLPYIGLESSPTFSQPAYNQSTVDRAGHFYTTDGGPDFFEYDRNGTLLHSWRGALGFTVGITVTPDGSIFVSDFDDATIHQFAADGKPVRRWVVDGGTIGPVGLAHDGKGNVYVALHRIHDHYVEKYSPGGKLLGTWAGLGSGDGQVGAGDHSGPEELAVMSDGTSYVADVVNNRLVKFEPDGAFAYAITGNGARRLAGPAVVAVDPDGNVFTMSMQTLWKFDPAGKALGRWFSPLDANIVIDADGNVFLVDRQISAVTFPAP